MELYYCNLCILLFCSSMCTVVECMSLGAVALTHYFITFLVLILCALLRFLVFDICGFVHQDR